MSNLAVERRFFLRRLTVIYASLEEDTILLRDQHYILEEKNKYLQRPVYKDTVRELKQFIKALDLVNIYRERFSEQRVFTFIRLVNNIIAERI